MCRLCLVYVGVSVAEPPRVAESEIQMTCKKCGHEFINVVQDGVGLCIICRNADILKPREEDIRKQRFRFETVGLMLTIAIWFVFSVAMLMLSDGKHPGMFWSNVAFVCIGIALGMLIMRLKNVYKERERDEEDQW